MTRSASARRKGYETYRGEAGTRKGCNNKKKGRMPMVVPLPLVDLQLDIDLEQKLGGVMMALGPRMSERVNPYLHLICKHMTGQVKAGQQDKRTGIGRNILVERDTHWSGEHCGR